MEGWAHQEFPGFCLNCFLCFLELVLLMVDYSQVLVVHYLIAQEFVQELELELVGF